MSTQPLRIYKDDLDKLKVSAAASGKDEKDIIHEMLGKAVPDELADELMDLAKARTPSHRKRSTETVEVQATSRSTEIGERLKGVIADAVETKVYLKTLGINLGDDSPPPWLQAALPQLRTQTTTPQPQMDIMGFITQIKALESLERRETDPEIKTILRDQKEGLAKAIEALGKLQQPKEDSFNERLERIALLRTLGQDKEADNAIRELKRDFEGKVSDLQEKVDEQKEDIHKMQLAELKTDLTKKIEDLQNRPDLLQQAKNIFDMAKDDPLMKDVVKAVAKKQLGIEEKKFSLGDLAKDFEQIPLGKAKDFIVGIINAVKGERAPTTEPPPPETEPPTIMTEEEAIVSKAAPALLKQLPTTEPATFAEEAEPEPQPQPQPEPVQEGLPEEPETEPEPESRGKPKGRKKQ